MLAIQTWRVVRLKYTVNPGPYAANKEKEHFKTLFCAMLGSVMRSWF
jgi:hypothetical protein